MNFEIAKVYSEESYVQFYTNHLLDSIKPPECLQKIIEDIHRNQKEKKVMQQSIEDIYSNPKVMQQSIEMKDQSTQTTEAPKIIKIYKRFKKSKRCNKKFF